MPIYEYWCETCEQRFEKLFLSLNRIPAQIECPNCQQVQVRRLISKPAKLKAGEDGGDWAETEVEPAKPPVIGRKEILEAQRKKRDIDPFEP